MIRYLTNIKSIVFSKSYKRFLLYEFEMISRKYSYGFICMYPIHDVIVDNIMGREVWYADVYNFIDRLNYVHKLLFVCYFDGFLFDDTV